MLDANVLVAAFATRGLCAELLEVVMDGHALLFSEELAKEVEVALRRKVGLAAELALEAVGNLREVAEMIEPAAVPRRACRDPQDLHVLGLALAGRAQMVVTGDPDLLVLGAFEGIPIVTPRGLWESLRSS